MSSEEVGELAGLASMRALAHPTRVAIVKLLEAHPALTATECGNALGFSAKTEIDREQWGMTWNQALETGGVMVSKKITIEIEGEAIRQD